MVAKKKAAKKKVAKKKAAKKKAAKKKAAKKKATIDWYEDAMQAREEALAEAFGPTSPPDQVIMPTDASLRELSPGFALLRFAPNEQQSFWLYVTHGVSQPQREEDAHKDADLGSEFAIAAPDDAPWPVAMLSVLASYAMNSGRPIRVHDRLPASDLMQDSPGGALLVLADPGLPTEFSTRRGSFELRVTLGVTAQEAQRARKMPGRDGSAVLEAVLADLEAGCVTDRDRADLTRTPAFKRAWTRHRKRLSVQPNED